MNATRPELPATLSGSCHCGRVRYRITLRSWRMTVCNCSICTKKGYLHLVVPKDDFELLCGQDALTTYTFNTHKARHTFCATCGMHPFYVPRSHPDGFSVNARCLDNVELSWFQKDDFDGQHWDEQVEEYLRRPTS